MLKHSFKLSLSLSSIEKRPLEEKLHQKNTGIIDNLLIEKSIKNKKHTEQIRIEIYLNPSTNPFKENQHDFTWVCKQTIIAVIGNIIL